MTLTLHIGIIGDYNPQFPPHTVTDDALVHAADVLGIAVASEWLATDSLVDDGTGDVEEKLAGFDALWCAPGSPYRSFAGALNAIRFARERGYPFLGTCGGFQHAVVEYARNVLGIEDAHHAEYDPVDSTLFVSPLACSLVGQWMRVLIKPNSLTYGFYGRGEAIEQYYCQFGLNPQYQSQLHDGGFQIAAVDQDGEARVLELPDRGFYLATLFVPQITSSPGLPHPLVVAYLKAAQVFQLQRQLVDTAG